MRGDALAVALNDGDADAHALSVAMNDADADCDHAAEREVITRGTGSPLNALHRSRHCCPSRPS